jgi:signal peptidase II
VGGAVRQVQGARRAAPLTDGDRASSPARVGPTRWVILAIGVIILLDQLTKSWAVANLADGPKHIFGDTVELALTRNGGSAFSRFQGITPVLAIGAIIVTIVLARVLRNANDRVLIIALTLLLGGALGNLMDRIFRSPGFLRGHVVDFVAVGWWPVFNVADSCVTIGAILLIICSLRTPSRPAPSSPPSPPS